MRVPCSLVRNSEGNPFRIIVKPWFSCFKRGIGSPVIFLLDTGSDISMLSELDVRRLNVAYESLDLLPKDEWVKGIGGKLPLYRIRDECKLTFGAPTGTKGKYEYHVETFRDFYATKVEIQDESIRKEILAGLPSILGMDVIRKFRLVATNQEAYLETR